MFLKVQSQVKMSEVAVNPLNENQKKQIIEEAFGEAANFLAQNSLNFIQPLKHSVRTYLFEYEKAWVNFNKAFNIKEQVKKRGTYHISNQIGFENAAVDFIRVLEKGEILLQGLRTILTGQIISTNITVVGSQHEIYRKDKKDIPYKLILSSYGASGNNFVSLAYQVDVNKIIQQFKSELSEQINENDNNLEQQALNKIYALKRELLQRKKYHSIYFDGTDNEILGLMLDNQISFENLTYRKYLNWRKRVGTIKGKQITSLQAGDRGLTQEKKVSKNTQSVNFARQTFIKLRFFELWSSLQSNDLQIIKNTFLKMFTIENTKNISDSLTRQTNAEARKVIKQLFKNIK